MDTKALAVKDALQPIRLADMSKRAVFDLAPIAVSTQGHFAQVVLVEEFACGTFHAEVAEPMATDDGAESGVVLGGGHDWFGFFAGGKYAAGLAVGEGVDYVGYAVFEDIVFEVVFYFVDRGWDWCLHYGWMYKVLVLGTM